jgi:hypothetical protein
MIALKILRTQSRLLVRNVNLQKIYRNYEERDAWFVAMVGMNHLRLI